MALILRILTTHRDKDRRVEMGLQEHHASYALCLDLEGKSMRMESHLREATIRMIAKVAVRKAVGLDVDRTSKLGKEIRVTLASMIGLRMSFLERSRHPATTPCENWLAKLSQIWGMMAFLSSESRATSI